MSTRARTRGPARAVSSRASGPPPPARSGAARRQAARPSARPRRRMLVVGIVVAVLLTVAFVISRSPLLAIDTLQVRGTSHLTTEQILDAAGVHEGDPMVWIDTSAAVQGIEALPYVREARLERQWPDTVRITVHERRPAAWVEGPAGTALVDGHGRVLAEVDAAPPAMPQLLGATVPPPGGTVDLVGAARVAGALTGLAAAGTTSVETTDHGIVLHLASGGEIRMGEATQIAVKLRAALAVLDASRDAPPSYVDVSVPTNPVAG